MLAVEERTNNIKDIAYYAADSRLTDEPDGKRYDMQMIIFVGEESVQTSSPILLLCWIKTYDYINGQKQ